MANAPTQTINLGLAILTNSMRRGAQLIISASSGSVALLVPFSSLGIQHTRLQYPKVNDLSISRPTISIALSTILSNSLPAGPQKGLPSTFSLSPGASPVISTSQGIDPLA